MNVLLVMTTGQTDVQLVVNERRYKLDGNTCGTLHDALRECTLSVVDAPNGRGDYRIKSLPAEPLSVCTPKLDAVLKYLAPSLPTSVLILGTQRDGNSDPRFAGEFMEQRLRARGVKNVTCKPFLTGDEQLEDPSDPLDAVVRRSVVYTLSDAIRQATADLNSDDHVIVATTGGLAAANELIGELVRLHCVGGPTVIELEVPDGNRTEQDDVAVEEAFHPASGYRARWRALSLIERGNLLGAWGAVGHLKNAPGQSWTQVVHWLALFASSLPLPDECDLSVLKHRRMAVRSALRVELALRAGDIPRAVHGTVAFFESALWDMLGERVERSNHPDRRRFFKMREGVEIPQELLRQGDGAAGDRTRPFELRDVVNGIHWYWIYDGDGGPGARIARHFIRPRPQGLVDFDTALSQGNIRQLRNDIAHNEPTPELMGMARDRMLAAELWSQTDTSNDTFLGQSIVQDVLKELGEDHPESLLTTLLVDVRARLIQCDPKDRL